LLYFETDPNSSIKTPSDALWWSFGTITTIGSADRSPITPEGRVVAAIMMIAGVGLFSTFTAYVASLFLEPEQKREEKDSDALHKEIKYLRDKMESIEKKLG
jgi:voltage-gated potassium channel